MKKRVELPTAHWQLLNQELSHWATGQLYDELRIHLRNTMEDALHEDLWRELGEKIHLHIYHAME